MRIVLADDHALLLDALDVALNGRGHDVVGMARSLDAVVPMVRVHAPDVCLLDVNFPEGSSLPLIQQVRAAVPHTKVVMMSADPSHDTVVHAIAAGADGFIAKDRAIAELDEALELALEGHLAVDPTLLKGALRMSESQDNPLWALSFLTDREWQVLRCVVDGMGTEEIATSLHVKRSTARTHVQNLLTKLGLHSRLQAVALIAAHGSADIWPLNVR